MQRKDVVVSLKFGLEVEPGMVSTSFDFQLNFCIEALKRGTGAREKQLHPLEVENQKKIQ